MSAQAKGKAKEKPIASLLAGATAGGVEAFITFPLESVKTQLQFGALDGGKPLTPYQALRSTIQQRGVHGLYAGCTAVVIGNAVKAGVRFTTYDQFKSLLKDDEGKLTAPRSMLAGLGAGMSEAIIAVTPSETIKTKMIEDSKLAQPRYQGLVHGVQTIIKEEGYRGVYRGVGPVVRHFLHQFIVIVIAIGETIWIIDKKIKYCSKKKQMLRQGANSAVRFSSYSTLKQLAQGSAVPGEDMPGWMTFGIGATAGVITVYSTMPFDVVKTRMQSIHAKQEYRNAFHCAFRIFKEEGVFKFWKGTVPRLGRLVMSGGIIFTVYEKTYPLVAAVL
ncbi:solute carrier family 25 (mitochondrial citrate transporter), member 1 [Cryptococcus neoformans]|nr:solute carrier family 25 (mitochondrial citrate transporter), member 1 [Cryptococcus neoformans var. grubii Th84]OXH00684.1 solute carrier family 25 (mitochondrial citrate transporter), member 1 [Cryptococcus neoformans var. grubii]OXH22393.1 solute carrier family 25 (mitochondrial citrate transporter), member 1 [Cryptococcus neoformans var. grubii]OXH42578.1 solute carrier family 25 (mitochondrial citrate transporter), member 1 [Cryptococcus neoformans var. grubii]OXH43083.1 solute carrier 